RHEQATVGLVGIHEHQIRAKRSCCLGNARQRPLVNDQLGGEAHWRDAPLLFLASAVTGTFIMDAVDLGQEPEERETEELLEIFRRLDRIVELLPNQSETEAE